MVNVGGRTRRSVNKSGSKKPKKTKRMNLESGDAVFVIIKATEVSVEAR